MAPPKRAPSGKEVGHPGVKQFAGYVNDEWDQRLRNRKTRFETFRQMTDDATVAALISALDALMRSTSHRLNPADDSPQAKEAAAFVTECIDDLDGAWGDQLSEINSQIVYGFSLFEIVYKVRPDGRIGWARWAPRAQETIDKWIFDDEGRDVTAAVQVAPPLYKTTELPLSSCLHFKTRRRNQSPEGVSLIRAAYQSWYAKHHISAIEAIGIERDLVGLPVMRLPADVILEGGANLAEWHTVLTNLKRDETSYIMVPSDTDENGNPYYDFSLQSTGGTRQIDTDVVIARYERLILRSMLADFLTLGDQGVGSFALGVSRADLFAHNVQALLESEADTINQQAILPLCALNGIPDDLAPTFAFDKIPSGHIGSFASALAQMATIGAIDVTDEAVRREVYDMLNLPYPDTGGDDVPDAETDDVTPGEEIPVEDTEAPTIEPADTEAPATFTEPLSDDLIKRGKAAWDAIVDEKWRGVLDADLVGQ